MSRLTRIVVVGGRPGAAERWKHALSGEAVDIRPSASPPSHAEAEGADLLLIDADDRGDVPAMVRACRRSLPPHTPVLVLGSPDPSSAAEAIDAGATDSVNANVDGEVLSAHVRRLLRQSDSLRSMVYEERRRAARESLTLAAADLARPLGELLDGLESVMARAPADDRLNELLDLTGRAVDAMDRLRRLAADPNDKGPGDNDHDGQATGM